MRPLNKFHGGCHECRQPLSICKGCQYYKADWTLPNLNDHYNSDGLAKVQPEVDPNQAFKLSKAGLNKGWVFKHSEAGLSKGWIEVICDNCGEEGLVGYKFIQQASYEEFKAVKCGSCYQAALSVKNPFSTLGGK